MRWCRLLIVWRRNEAYELPSWRTIPSSLNDRKHSPVVFDKVITLCAQAELTPRIGATATVGSGVITLVEAGEGVAILPEGSRSLGTDALVFIPLTDSGASVDLVIAWVGTAHQSCGAVLCGADSQASQEEPGNSSELTDQRIQVRRGAHNAAFVACQLRLRAHGDTALRTNVEA